MDALASEIGVAATAIARLAAQQQGYAPIALGSAGEILTVLEAGIEDLLEVFDET